ncbi:MAG: hypothetical protein AB7E79_08975 [Rhodospirillaceae bacterium]
MGLAFVSADAPHLNPVMQAAEHSLSFLMEDLQTRRQACLIGKSGADLEDWVNALQRQGQPLVASTQGRANLEAWLALVEG